MGSSERPTAEILYFAIIHSNDYFSNFTVFTLSSKALPFSHNDGCAISRGIQNHYRVRDYTWNSSETISGRWSLC